MTPLPSEGPCVGWSPLAFETRAGFLLHFQTTVGARRAQS